MIIVEKITIGKTDYKHTFSNEGFYIEREDVLYEDAVDPINSDRLYNETDILIEIVEEALNDTEN